MWRKAPTDARGFRRSTQLLTRSGRLPAPSGGGAVDDTEQRPDRQGRANLQVRGQLTPRPAVHAHLATPAALPGAHHDGTAGTVKVGLGEVECFADPQPGSPQHDDQRSQAGAVRTVAGGAHDGDDLFDRWRVGGKA